MDRQGLYKVGNFGSYFEKKDITQAATATGTLFYMSPRQRCIFACTAERYDVYASDVFSLGMTTLAFASATLVDRLGLIDRAGTSLL